MQQTLTLIRVSLEGAADPKHRDGMSAYFKETIRPLGVRSAEMNRIVASAWRRVCGWSKDEILELCDRLWEAGTFEEGSLACKLSARLSKRMDESDFARLERWMDTRVSNWAHCDDLAAHALGSLVAAHPRLFPQMAGWTGSDNRWMRRGCMVALIYPLKKGDDIESALRLADTLLADSDDLVQKGLGWMLKEATRHHSTEVFQYLLVNRLRMSRIALRTAVEKLPQELKSLAMQL